MAGDRIGVGVIGLGMGTNMLALNEDPASGFEVRAVCSQSAEHARAVAEGAGLAFWTTDYRELVARSDVEVVGIYSPDHLHAEHATAALQAGKHVVCTKPMVTSFEDAVRLVGLVEQTGLTFLVGQTMRFDPEFLMAKRLYDDGDLGRVSLAEAHYVHDMRSVFPLTPWRLHAPQDLMYGGVTHPLDLLRWFLGEVTEVHALGSFGDTVPGYPREANFVLNLRFAGGAIGRVLGAFALVEPPLPMMGLGLYGSRASLVAEYTDQAPGRVRLVLDKVATHPTTVTDFPARPGGSYGHGDAVARYMAHFRACLAGEATPSPGVRDGAASVAIAAAAWESVRSGQVVAVPALPQAGG